MFNDAMSVHFQFTHFPNSRYRNIFRDREDGTLFVILLALGRSLHLLKFDRSVYDRSNFRERHGIG